MQQKRIECKKLQRAAKIICNFNYGCNAKYIFQVSTPPYGYLFCRLYNVITLNIDICQNDFIGIVYPYGFFSETLLKVTFI